MIPDATRLIYLDSDVLVRADLGPLWREPTELAVAAVRDLKCPTFATGLPHAIAALGVAPETPYYNSGVLLLNLDAWRRENLTQRATGYIHDHGTTIKFADQDPLNAVTAGRVHELDPVWNAQVAPMNDRAIVERDRTEQGVLADLKTLRREARIVHFTGYKPWQPEGLRASRWSIALHVEFARVAAKFSDQPRSHQISAGSRWAGRLLRRSVYAARKRLG
jgi:lipopolysaccharide biosynthesis glycosyltransferase